MRIYRWTIEDIQTLQTWTGHLCLLMKDGSACFRLPKKKVASFYDLLEILGFELDKVP